MTLDDLKTRGKLIIESSNGYWSGSFTFKTDIMTYVIRAKKKHSPEEVMKEILAKQEGKHTTTILEFITIMQENKNG